MMEAPAGRSEMSSPGTESSIKHEAGIMLQVIKAAWLRKVINNFNTSFIYP